MSDVMREMIKLGLMDNSRKIKLSKNEEDMAVQTEIDSEDDVLDTKIEESGQIMLDTSAFIVNKPEETEEDTAAQAKVDSTEEEKTVFSKDWEDEGLNKLVKKWQEDKETVDIETQVEVDTVEESPNEEEESPKNETDLGDNLGDNEDPEDEDDEIYEQSYDEDLGDDILSDMGMVENDEDFDEKNIYENFLNGE